MSNNQENISNLDHTEAIEKMQEIIDHNAICLLTTDLTNLPLQTRPMTVQQVCDQGNFWFLSASDSEHNQQIDNDPRVQLFFSNPSNQEFMTIYGVASISRDKEKIEELWNPIVKAWFKEGKEDPRVTVIKVTPENGFYWDTKNGKFVSLIKIITKALNGGKTSDGGVEGKLAIKSESL